jgi:DNA topoisomerase-1
MPVATGSRMSLDWTASARLTVVDSYLEGDVLTALQRRTERRLAQRLGGLRPEEAAVLALLQQRLRREADRDAARRAA